MSDPPQQQPLNPIESQLVSEWHAAQVSQRHIGEAIDKILGAWRADRARITELDAQVVALLRRVAEVQERVAVLESHPVELINLSFPPAPNGKVIDGP